MRLRGHGVIISFLVLTLLGIVLIVFWIAWWLMADLLNGSHARPVGISRSSHELPRTARPSTKRPAIGD